MRMWRNFTLVFLYFSIRQCNDTKLLAGKGMQLFSRSKEFEKWFHVPLSRILLSKPNSISSFVLLTKYSKVVYDKGHTLYTSNVQMRENWAQEKMPWVFWCYKNSQEYTTIEEHKSLQSLMDQEGCGDGGRHGRHLPFLHWCFGKH